MSQRSTYVRKIGEGRFEYGFVEHSKNFRKRADVFSPAGIASTVVAAEAARASLSSDLPHHQKEVV